MWNTVKHCKQSWPPMIVRVVWKWNDNKVHTTRLNSARLDSIELTCQSLSDDSQCNPSYSKTVSIASSSIIGFARARERARSKTMVRVSVTKIWTLAFRLCSFQNGLCHAHDLLRNQPEPQPGAIFPVSFSLLYSISEICRIAILWHRLSSAVLIISSEHRRTTTKKPTAAKRPVFSLFRSQKFNKDSIFQLMSFNSKCSIQSNNNSREFSAEMCANAPRDAGHLRGLGVCLCAHLKQWID